MRQTPAFDTSDPLRGWLAGTLMILAMAIGGQQALAQSPERPPQKTGYVTVEREEVPVVQTMTGRAVAQNRTQIRPRVGGALTAILYTPGAMVEVGTPLFEIDPLTYEIAVTVAEATLARAQAELDNSRATHARASKLQGAATSVSAVELAQTNLIKAEASVAEAEASLRLARAQLEWATVRAPITGIVGVADVSVGDLVTANQTTALAEIVQTDPIMIDLTEPYPLRLRTESRAAAGEIELTSPRLALTLDGGRLVEGAASLQSSSATVSTTTGSRTLRFEMANGAGLIAPGMFVQGALTIGRTDAFLVPQRATTRERDGTLTAWVDDQGIARKRVLTATGTSGNAWIVQSGLQDGDRVLIDGTTNLRDGARIEPVPAMIDDQGVVRDTAAVTN